MTRRRSRLLERTAEIASDYRASLATRPVGGPVDLAALRAALGGPLPDGPTDPLTVIEHLAAAADPGLVASAGPRYFGFVFGGGLPAALAADWLASTWDQNAFVYVASPAAAVAEEVAAGWLVDLLGLPAGTSVGFVTGATMANFTAIAAARHAVLARAGWDVDRHGLQGAPLVTVITHEGSHATVTPRWGCSVSAARATASGGSRPTTRAGCARMPCAPSWRGSTGRSSSAPRPGT